MSTRFRGQSGLDEYQASLLSEQPVADYQSSEQTGANAQQAIESADASQQAIEQSNQAAGSYFDPDEHKRSLAQIDLQRNQISQQRLAIAPNYKETQKRHTEAKKAFEDLQKESITQAKNGTWLATNSETGKIRALDPALVAKAKDERRMAEDRFKAVDSEYSPLEQKWKALEDQERAAEAEKLRQEEIALKAKAGLIQTRTKADGQKVVAQQEEPPGEVYKDGDYASFSGDSVTWTPQQVRLDKAAYEEQTRYNRGRDRVGAPRVISPLTAKIIRMEMAKRAAQSKARLGDIDPATAQQEVQRIELQQQKATEEAKRTATASLTAKITGTTPPKVATPEEIERKERHQKGIELAAKTFGSGFTVATKQAGGDAGVIESAKGALNDATDTGAISAYFFRRAKGDIDLAIALANSQGSDLGKEADDYKAPAGEKPFGMRSAMKSAARQDTEAAKALKDLKQSFIEAGITDPKEQRTVIEDAAKANAWTEKDKVRTLSNGNIVFNPSKTFGDYEGMVKEIETKAKEPGQAKEAVQMLDAMRKESAEAIDSALWSADNSNSLLAALPRMTLRGGPILGAATAFLDGYRDFVKEENGKGNFDKVKILDEFSKKEENKFFMLKVNDALESGITGGAVGIYKTNVGVGTSIAGAVGADNVAEGLARQGQYAQGAIEDQGVSDQQRGLASGAYGLTNDLSNTVTQMAPMFIGGNVAGGLKGVAQLVTRELAVTGWAAAQGWESMGQRAIDHRNEQFREEQAADPNVKPEDIRDLNAEEIVQLLQDPKVIQGQFFNGLQTAALARLMPKGAERGPLGIRADSMTVRQFLAGGGKRAWQSGTFRREAKKMAKTIWADASDEAVEETLNQMLEGMIAAATDNGDMKLGDLVFESIQAGGMGAIVGGGVNQVYAGRNVANEHGQIIERMRQRLAAPADPELLADALAEIDPTQGPTTQEEVAESRKLVGQDTDQFRQVARLTEQYREAEKNQDWKEAERIDQEIQAMATETEVNTVRETADAVLLNRELKETDQETKAAFDQAQQDFNVAQASGDRDTKAAAGQALAVAKQARNEHLQTRAAVKIASGMPPSALTDAEARAMGWKQTEDGSGMTPMTAKELKDQGLTVPLLRPAADGTAILTDDAVATVRATSERAGKRVKLSEQEAAELAQRRVEEQSPAPSGVPTDSLPDGQGAAPGGTAPTASPQTNETNGQNTQGPEGQAAQPAANPQTPQASTDSSGGGTQSVPQSTTTAAATPQEATPVATVGPAAMEAAQYEAARQQDPALPEIPQQVAQSFQSGQPVSVSMQKQSGIEVPDGYARNGGMWEPIAVQTPAGNAPQARQIAETVKQQIETQMPALQGRIQIEDKESGTGGAELDIQSGTITLTLPDIQRELEAAGGDVEAATESLANIVARHEVVHAVQIDVLRSMWEAAGSQGTFEEFFNRYYTDLSADLLTPEAVAAAREIYGKAPDGSYYFDRITSPANQAAEFVRMLVEAKIDGKEEQFSELFRVVKTQGAKSKLAELIRRAVEMLRSMSLTPQVQEHVAKLEELYKQLAGEQKATTNATPAEGLRIDSKGGQSQILDGDTVLWQGPASEARAELQNLEAAAMAPLRITGDAIKDALRRFPKLSGKNRDALEAAADEVTEELEALSPGDRRAAAQKAIADKINEIADREAEAKGKKREEVIESFRATAGKRAAQQAASIEDAVIGAAPPVVPDGRVHSRETPNSEMRVEVTSTFVDLDQLVGSSDPLFPGRALQPRDRSKAANRNQREEMVKNIRDKDEQARRYIEGPTTDSGRMVIAPLFDADGQHMVNEAGKPLYYVISGNGRRNAMAEAHARKVTGKIDKGFRDAAAEEGIDVQGMSLPVPVSIFVPTTPKEAIELAEYSNRDAQLSVTNTEQANRDAASIEKGNLLPLWDQESKGNAAAAGNRDFVKAFALATGDEGIIDRRGNVTDEGAKRIERAMVAMLLGPEQANTLDLLFNRANNLGLRTIIGGIASESGSLLALAAEKPEFDITPALAEALQTAIEAKQSLANGEIRTLSEFFDQGNLFNDTTPTPERQLARVLVESRNRKTIRQILEAYRTAASSVDTTTISMFAEAETSSDDLILRALEVRPIESTLAEIEAEFGESSDLAAKIREITGRVKRMDSGQRREFTVAIQAEADRLREGVISADEWQRLNPDSLTEREALFQRFLDSHTPKTIRSGMNRMLSKPVQEALASSPAPAKLDTAGQILSELGLPPLERIDDTRLGSSPASERPAINIPRKDMPQIPINRRGRFRRWLESEGVSVSINELRPDTLTPSQADLWDTALVGARKHTRTRNIIVSNDGYILDGHHQWAAAKEKGKDKIAVAVIDLPVRDALAKMHEFSRVESDALPGTEYENEEYQYGGKATEDWRTINHQDAGIVNPIDPDLSPDEKTDAMLNLSYENVPLVEQILTNLRENVGVEGKYSIKLPERIQGKASRPSIREQAPWHDIEHVRDGLRFKVTLTHFNQIEGIVQEFVKAGIEIIKFDTKKMFAPKEWGWRFIGFDMRMPNGQLVEFYAPLGTMDQKSVKGPNHLLFEKWRNTPKHVWFNDRALAAERAADVKESRYRYDAGFMAGIEAMGLTYEEAKALFNNLVSAAESVISSQSDMGPLRTPSVQISGSESRQADSPARMMSARPSPGKRSLAPSSEAYAKGLVEGFEVEDTADKDGEATTNSRQNAIKRQGNSDPRLASSPAPELDLFAGIEEQTFGPRAKMKRNAAQALRKAPDEAKPKIASEIAKREGLADLDLFAQAAVKNLDAEPRKSEFAFDDGDLFSGSDRPGNRQPERDAASQPGGSGDVRQVAGEDGDLFDLAATRPGQRGGSGSSGIGGRSGIGSNPTTADADGGTDVEGSGPSGDGTGVSSGERSPRLDVVEIGTAELPAEVPVPDAEEDRNARIDPRETLSPKGIKAKIEANFAAVKLLRTLNKEGRNPTAEEKRILLSYSGWGFSKGAFDDVKAKEFEKVSDGQNPDAYYNKEWSTLSREEFKRKHGDRHKTPDGKEKASIYDLYAWNENHGDTHRRLMQEFSQEEYNAARRSVLNAHYTTPSVINGMWKMLEKIGFKGGRVLEPGAGIGHFIGTQPEHLADRSEWNAVELDKVTAQILSKLYPQVRVNSEAPNSAREVDGQGFEESRIAPNSMDLVISNVPFHEIGPWQAKKQFGMDMNLHNYFFARALELTRPGGLVAFITSSSTMENNAKQREFLASRGELVAAIRLPNTAFKENAGTEVTTDIIILRKPDGRKIDKKQWFQSREIGRDNIQQRREKDQSTSNVLRSFDPSGTWLDPELESARLTWKKAEAAYADLPTSGKNKATKPEIAAAKKADTDAWKAYQNAYDAAEARSENGKVGANVPIRVNEYFKDHPTHAFGEHKLQGSMYRANEYTMAPDAGPSIDMRFDEAIRDLPENITGKAESIELATFKDAEKGDRPFSFIERGGKIYQVEGDSLSPVEWSQPEVMAFRSWGKLRDATRALIAAELDPGAKDAELDAMRQNLNLAYDRHVSSFGPVSKTGRGSKHTHLIEDPNYPLTAALEEERREAITRALKSGPRKGTMISEVRTVYDKADIFRSRMNKPLMPPEKAENVSEALTASLVWMGYPNADYMGKLLGREAEEVMAEAVKGGMVFLDPQTGEHVIADSYLSGHVQGKLDAAIEAAKDNPEFQANVKSLEAALPPRKTIGKIGINFGSTWLPTEVIEAYMENQLEMTQAKVRYEAKSNYWSVFGVGDSAKYSTNKVKTVELLSHALSMTTPKVKKDIGSGKNKKTVPDEGGAQMAASKLAALKEDFSKWVKTTDVVIGEKSVQEITEEAFNRIANGHVPPQFKGEHITLPGASDIVYRNGIRRAAIARMLEQGGGMIAHGVGFGKTFTLIGLAMELKRLGKANRPMITVENATIHQFAASFRAAYPNARLLVADEKSFEGPNRRRFVSRIATGDFDAIVMAHSQFNLIANHPDVVNSWINQQIDELKAVKGEVDSSNKRAVAALEAAMISLENTRKKILDSLATRQDMGLYWEDLGVDALLVDEAHRYKNAPVITRMQDVKNIPTGTASQRAIGMVLKTNSVRARNAGRGVFFATGTPVTNTMAEAYIMMRFTNPELLEQQGIYNFDNFAAQYGSVVTNIESTWKGKLESVTRFAKFVNGPSLINLIRSSWDVQMDPDLAGLKRPTVKGGRPELLTLQPGPGNELFNSWVTDSIAAQWEDPNFWQNNPWGTNKREAFEQAPWLQAVPIMTMQSGIAAALDVRLLDTKAEDHPDSKINTAVRRIKEDYDSSEDRRGTQAVFIDLRKPFKMDHLIEFAGDPGLSEDTNEEIPKFDLYADLVDKLVTSGIPRKEIGIVSSDTPKKKRSAIFEKVNSGEIRVVIGSSDTMGVGVNMQERLFSMHHMMPPRDFKPAMMEQRNGRILRQGNQHYEFELEAFVKSAEESTGKRFRKDKNGRKVPDLDAARAALEGNEEALAKAEAAAEEFHIKITEYGMEKSIDSAIYQMMTAKQRFITQILMGEVTDSFEDPTDEVAMSMAEMAARTMGDPLMIRRVELDRDIKALSVEYNGWIEDVSDSRSAVAKAERSIVAMRKSLPELQYEAEKLKPILADTREHAVWELDGKVIDRNKPEDAEKGWKAPKLKEPLDLFLLEKSKDLRRTSKTTQTFDFKVNGVTLTVQVDQSFTDDRANGSVYLQGSGRNGNSRQWTGAGGLIAAVKTLAANAAALPAEVEAKIETETAKIPKFKERANQPFEKQKELDALYKEMEQVEAKLRGKGKELAPLSEGPETYPGAGLAPEMQALGSSPGPQPSIIRSLDNPSRGSEAATDERNRDPGKILETIAPQGDGEGSLRADDRKRGKSGRERVSAAGLLAWAQDSGRILNPTPLVNTGGENHPQGGEHVVLFDPSTTRVVKLTKPGFFGAQGEDAGAYLQRWALHNRAFGDDVAFEGLVTLPGEDLPRAVISQAFAQGKDATPQEQRDFLIEKGFIETEDGRWIHPIREIVAWDTITPGNAIMTESGVRFIDLQMAIAPKEELEAIREKSGIGRKSLFSSPAAFSITPMETIDASELLPIANRQEAEALFADGKTIYGLDEMEEGITPITSLEMLNSFPPDALLYDSAGTLGSSPSPESDPAQVALAKMPPIYRKVFEAVNRGDAVEKVASEFNITPRAVENILNQVRARVEVARKAASKEGLQPAMQGEQIDGGRPDLALGAIPQVAAVDQIRNESGVPDVRGWEEVNEQARSMLIADYQGTFDMLLAKARDLQPMTDLEVAATKIIISRETLSGKIQTPEERMKLAMLIHGYRDIGTETARSLAIRRDPHMSPAERHAQFIAEALFTPDAATRARMRKNPEQAEKILERWTRRIDAIKAELLAQGIDLDAALAEFNERQEAQKEAMADSPQTAAIIDEQIRKLTKREKAVIEAIRSGALVTKAAFITGLSTDEVKAIYSRFMTDIRSAMAETAKKFLEGSLASSPGDLMGSILTDLGLPDLDSIDDTRPDFEQTTSTEKPKRKPKKKPTKPTPRDLTPEQREELDQAWEDLVKSDFKGWENWRAKQIELGLDPINETTGTFDIHDPLSVRRVIDAFALARGTKADAMMEFWKASILTGPQTHIVNTTSNLLNAAYHALPKRASEALINNLLGTVGQGSNRKATFGEFAPMAKSLRKATVTAARNALRSWHTEGRVFEAYASAQPLQLDFTGMKAEYIPPAMSGKIGKVMRSLSFRAMTMVDEFIKTLYGTMEAAAQAHRIAAKEEMRKGADYEARLNELMEPGSVAWVRAIDGAKLITFQSDMDGSDPKLIRRIDQMAEAMKKGRNLPYLGKPLSFFLPFIDTPTNIFKIGVEMSPLGTFVALVDGLRALRRRIFKGDMTPEEANLAASELYDRARLVEDVTNQTIAWITFFALQGLVGGGDDDDELPVITGTVPYKTTKRGVRDNTYAVMPPMTIRIGGLEFSYNRFEPFSVALSSMVDLISIANKNGGYMAPEVASEWTMRFKDAAKDKTFLQGISSLLDAIEDPDRFGERLASNIATGFVPNVIRQPLRETDLFIRDTSPQSDDGFFTSVAKRVGYAIVPQAAPAKVDVWGNPIRANRGKDFGGAETIDRAFRVFDPTNAQLSRDIDPLDRWIFLWNLRTADKDEQVSVMPIWDRLQITVPGEGKVNVDLSEEETLEANRQAGQAARAILGEGWETAPYNPETAKRIVDTVRGEQARVRAEIRQRKLAEMLR